MKRQYIHVVGYKGHGKDHVCEYLRSRYGLTYIPTTPFMMEEACLPYLKGRLNVSSVKELMRKKQNIRPQLYEAVNHYNKDNPTRFIEKVFEVSDIYCGLRNIEQLEAAQEKGFADIVIWVDASKRLPEEGRDSFTITHTDCDIYIDNNRGLFDLHKQLDVLCRDGLLTPTLNKK